MQPMNNDIDYVSLFTSIYLPLYPSREQKVFAKNDLGEGKGTVIWEICAEMDHVPVEE